MDLNVQSRSVRVVVVGLTAEMLASLIREPRIDVVAFCSDLDLLAPALSNRYVDFVLVSSRSLSGIGSSSLAELVAALCPQAVTVVVGSEGRVEADASPPERRNVVTVGGGEEELLSAVLDGRTSDVRSPGDVAHGHEGGAVLPGPARARGPVGPGTSGRVIAAPPRGSDRDGPAVFSIPARSRGGGADVVTIFGSKGGVGKTLVAVSVAVLNAEREAGRVALLDFDLRGGDVAVHLDLVGREGLCEVVPFAGELSPQLLKRCMTRHPSSGLDVLLGPGRPDAGELVGNREVVKILETCRASYDLVIVDTPPSLEDVPIGECLRRSSLALLVTTPDAAALRQARVAVEVLERTKVLADRCAALVVNRWSREYAVTVDQIHSFVGLRPCAVLADDARAVHASVLRGTPLVQVQRTHSLAVSLRELAAFIRGCRADGAPSEGRLGLWTRILRRVRNERQRCGGSEGDGNGRCWER